MWAPSFATCCGSEGFSLEGIATRERPFSAMHLQNTSPGPGLLDGECGGLSCSVHESVGVQRNAESQRDSGMKPRVARNELPWGNEVGTFSTPTGLRHEAERVGRNPVGVETPVGSRSQ